MSNYLAIATVTATLKYLVVDAVAHLGASVTTQRPGAPVDATGSARVNIYLHQAVIEPQFRNQDLPNRDRDGRLVGVPTSALNLRYMLTFYGNEQELMPDRLMGRVLTKLHAEAVMTREMIEHAILAERPIVDLSASDLSSQPVLVRLQPTPLNYDDLYRLWSVFTQTPYSLSTHFEAGPVLVAAPARPVVAIPVRRARTAASLFAEPLIERIVYPYPPGTPLRDAGLALEGRNLAVANPRISLESGGQVKTLTPAVEQVDDNRIVLDASALQDLRYGPVRTRLVRMNDDEIRLPTAQSPWSSMAYRPVVVGLSHDAASGEIVATLERAVGERQKVALLLRRRMTAPDGYELEPNPRGEPMSTLRFAARDLVAGRYFAFARVDGTESGLDSPAHNVVVP